VKQKLTVVIRTSQKNKNKKNKDELQHRILIIPKLNSKYYIDVRPLRLNLDEIRIDICFSFQLPIPTDIIIIYVCK